MSLLRLEGVLVRGGGRTLLDVPSLEVEEGEIHVVLGPTGAGKSTLLRIVNRLQRPERGSVHWRGESVPWPAPLEFRRRMTMVFQSPLLFSGTTFDNVAYGLRLRGERDETLRPKVDAMLQLFRIGHLAQQRAATLSGGEAQRAALARALVLRPEMLLLDEPLASLDPRIRECLLRRLRQIVAGERITCVYVTHEQTEAFAIADRIAILSEGRVLQVGTPEAVFYRPSGPAVADFLQTANILTGEVVAAGAGVATVRIPGGMLKALSDLAPGSHVLVCVRPEEILLTSSEGVAANAIEGTVTSVLDQGPTLKADLDCGFPLTALVTRRTAREILLRAGARVGVSFEPEAVHLIARGQTADLNTLSVPRLSPTIRP